MIGNQTIRMLWALAGSLCIHGAGLLGLGIIGGYFYHPASVTWSQGTNSIEISVNALNGSDYTPPSPAPSKPLHSIKDAAPKIAQSRTENHVSESHAEMSNSPSKPSPAASASGSPTKAEPSISYSPIPPYPESARKSGLEGVVTLRVRIDTRGSVSRIQLLQSSGYPEFDEAALKTVKNRWRFSPAMCSGIPFESDKDIRVRFVLK